jgi:hypothetical protein
MLQTHSAVGGIAALIGGSSTLLDHLKDVLSHKFAEDPGELHCASQLFEQVFTACPVLLSTL